MAIQQPSHEIQRFSNVMKKNLDQEIIAFFFLSVFEDDYLFVAMGYHSLAFGNPLLLLVLQFGFTYVVENFDLFF
ncbi:hypothetical protein MKW98_019504 [Papaver atlanticum]|uniref:Uncharacterized protein n=1 Tax=Papaver atlanticum TaxID=357466 RepID=A0AAD4S8E7_9MAGN|nr:hypothetical protein MKW98_019504 [Papaver atlanticum]